MHLTHSLPLIISSLHLGASAFHLPRAQSSTNVRTTARSLNPAAITTVAAGVTYDGCTYSVAGTGKFTERALYSFTSGTTLPDGLYPSDYTVYDTDDNPNAPYNHRFQPQNVIVSGGYLNLKVPGAQKPSTDADKAINSAEIATSREDILYASVRTKAMFSDVAGTCQGAFFYASDQAEIDIEYLSDPTSQSNNGRRPNPLWYTNQKITPSSPTTATAVAGLANETTTVNEYRIDWIKGQSKFYVNGNLQLSYTQNVPNVAGPWIWNNWSNGDKGWSVGPPAKDNLYKITTIDMFFNTTSSAGKKC